MVKYDTLEIGHMKQWILNLHLSGSRVAKSLYGLITVHAVLVVLSLGDYGVLQILWTIMGTITFISIAEAYSEIVGRHIDKHSPMRTREFMQVWCESRYLFLGSLTIVFFFLLALFDIITKDLAFTLSYLSSAFVLFFYGVYYGIGADEGWVRSLLMGFLNAGLVYIIILLKSLF